MRAKRRFVTGRAGRPGTGPLWAGRHGAGLVVAGLVMAAAAWTARPAAAQEPDTTVVPATEPGVVPAPGPAGPGAVLGLREVVESALRTHPALGAAEARVTAAEAAAGEARAAWLPTVATSAVAMRYEEPMVVAPLHGFDPQSPPSFDETLYQGHATVDYTLFDGGARSARVRAAEGLTGAAEAGVAGARDAVVAEAVSAYLAVLTAEDVVVAHARRVEALETERARASLMLEQGKAPRVALLRTEAALSRARAEHEATTERRQLADRRLARVSGLDPTRILGARLQEVAPRPVEGPDREALVAVARAANPRLRQAERHLAAAEARVGAARSAYLPRVALAGRYSAFGSPSTDLQPEWNAGLQVSYPVFTGGARARAVERARAEADAAAAEARLAGREAEEAVDRALLAYRSARARAEALAVAVTQSEEVARIEALALGAGAGVQTDYLRAEAELLAARAALAEARHAAVEARVGLALATGALSVDGLERIIEVAP